MIPIDRLSAAFRADKTERVVVRAPQPHEGINRALKASFGSVPAMPEDFEQLLSRLR